MGRSACLRMLWPLEVRRLCAARPDAQQQRQPCLSPAAPTVGCQQARASQQRSKRPPPGAHLLPHAVHLDAQRHLAAVRTPRLIALPAGRAKGRAGRAVWRGRGAGGRRPAGGGGSMHQAVAGGERAIPVHANCPGGAADGVQGCRAGAAQPHLRQFTDQRSPRRKNGPLSVLVGLPGSVANCKTAEWGRSGAQGKRREAQGGGPSSAPKRAPAGLAAASSSSHHGHSRRRVQQQRLQVAQDGRRPVARLGAPAPLVRAAAGHWRMRVPEGGGTAAAAGQGSGQLPGLPASGGCACTALGRRLGVGEARWGRGGAGVELQLGELRFLELGA